MARPRAAAARVVEAEAVEVKAPTPTPTPAPPPPVEAVEAPPPEIPADVLRRRRVAAMIAAAMTPEELARAEAWADRRAAAGPAAPGAAAAPSGPGRGVLLAIGIGAGALWLTRRRGRR